MHTHHLQSPLYPALPHEQQLSTYGCISTPYTDIVPTLNNDTVNATNNFPDDLYEQGLQYFEEGNISEAVDAVEGICARTRSLQDMIRTV